MVMPVPQPKRLSDMEERAFKYESDVRSVFFLLRQLFSQFPITVKELTQSVFPEHVFHKTIQEIVNVTSTCTTTRAPAVK